jgi:hypothetical protein
MQSTLPTGGPARFVCDALDSFRHAITLKTLPEHFDRNRILRQPSTLLPKGARPHNRRVRTPDPKYDEQFAKGARLERVYGLLLYGGPLIIAVAALPLIVDNLRWYYSFLTLAFAGIVGYSLLIARRKLKEWPSPGCGKPLHISASQQFRPWPRRCPHCQLPKPSLWLRRSRKKGF